MQIEMLKLSKMTDYAVIILSDMARQKEKVLSATMIAQSTRLPEPTVSKVLKSLSKFDLVNSVRGANGGYSLTKAPENINMAHVILATDGPVELTACVDNGSQCCDLADSCHMKGQWNPLNAAMKQALENVSLKEMMGGCHE